MILKLRVLPSLPRPQLADACVLGDVQLEASLIVKVGNYFGFEFERDGEDWTNGRALTIGRGGEVDEAWLTAARTVAVEALRKELAKAGGPAFAAADTIQCEECGKLLCSTELADTPRWDSVICGPAHVVFFPNSENVLVFRPDGTAIWTMEPKAPS